MDKKNTVIIILVLALIVLAGFTYYLNSRGTKCKVMATDLGAKLQQCSTGLNQYKSGVVACQGVLAALKQVPACASYVPAP
jgi:hypothetical protein